MYFNFLSLWELTLRSNITDEELKQLIPNRIGKFEEPFRDFSLIPSKTLIMLMGAPGSGKTTLAEKLKQHCTENNLSAKIISMDKLITDYLQNSTNILNNIMDIDWTNFNMVCFQDEFNKSVNAYDIIILDGTFLSISERFVILKTVSEYYTNIIGIFLNTNPETLKEVQSERLFTRLPSKEFENWIEQAKQTLNEKEKLPVGFDTVYIVQK